MGPSFHRIGTLVFRLTPCLRVYFVGALCQAISRGTEPSQRRNLGDCMGHAGKTIVVSFGMLLFGCASGVSAEADGGVMNTGLPPTAQAGEAACGLDCPVCDTWATVISGCVMQWAPAEQADFSNRCSRSAQKWSSAFGSQFSACISSVDCANLENGDDICFPSSLQAIANGSLDSNIIAGCFRESTDACRSAVAASIPGPSVVSSCLQKWVSCMADPNAFEQAFSEDLCLSSLGLTPAAQVGVQQCLTQDCTAVGACLQNAGAFNW